jgi:acetyl-CoA carboxylase biotin carboxyl carrier protein
MSLSYKEVAEILKIIDASSCEEVVLEVGSTRLVVRRGGAQVGGEDSAPKVENIPPKKKSLTQASPGSTDAGGSVNNSDDVSGMILRAPMVGTFYSSPSPEEGPFVKEGSKVTAGDPLCLIEVMKLYTTIEATADGVVESILVEDGKLVEFDQPLFVIRNND